MKAQRGQTTRISPAKIPALSSLQAASTAGGSTIGLRADPSTPRESLKAPGTPISGKISSRTKKEIREMLQTFMSLPSNAMIDVLVSLSIPVSAQNFNPKEARKVLKKEVYLNQDLLDRAGDAVVLAQIKTVAAKRGDSPKVEATSEPPKPPAIALGRLDAEPEKAAAAIPKISPRKRSGTGLRVQTPDSPRKHHSGRSAVGASGLRKGSTAAIDEEASVPPVETTRNDAPVSPRSDASPLPERKKGTKAKYQAVYGEYEGTLTHAQKIAVLDSLFIMRKTNITEEQCNKLFKRSLATKVVPLERAKMWISAAKEGGDEDRRSPQPVAARRTVSCASNIANTEVQQQQFDEGASQAEEKRSFLEVWGDFLDLSTSQQIHVARQLKIPGAASSDTDSVKVLFKRALLSGQVELEAADRRVQKMRERVAMKMAARRAAREAAKAEKEDDENGRVAPASPEGGSSSSSAPNEAGSKRIFLQVWADFMDLGAAERVSILEQLELEVGTEKDPATVGNLLKAAIHNGSVQLEQVDECIRCQQSGELYVHRPMGEVGREESCDGGDGQELGKVFASEGGLVNLSDVKESRRGSGTARSPRSPGTPRTPRTPRTSNEEKQPSQTLVGTIPSITVDESDVSDSESELSSASSISERDPITRRRGSTDRIIVVRQSPVSNRQKPPVPKRCASMTPIAGTRVMKPRKLTFLEVWSAFTDLSNLQRGKVAVLLKVTDKVVEDDGRLSREVKYGIQREDYSLEEVNSAIKKVHQDELLSEDEQLLKADKDKKGKFGFFKKSK